MTTKHLGSTLLPIGLRHAQFDPKQRNAVPTVRSRFTPHDGRILICGNCRSVICAADGCKYHAAPNGYCKVHAWRAEEASLDPTKPKDVCSVIGCDHQPHKRHLAPLIITESSTLGESVPPPPRIASTPARASLIIANDQPSMMGCAKCITRGIVELVALEAIRPLKPEGLRQY